MSDQTLTEYISNLLRQGYTETQVRQYLLQNRYPKSMIDAAFQTISGNQGPTQLQAPVTPPTNQMVNQLVSYLRTYLAQGYQVEQLRPYLIQQRYAPGDVEQAINLVTGQQTIRHEVHFPIATIAKLTFLLFICVGIWYGYGLFFGGEGGENPITTGETRILDILTPTGIKSSYAPGETIEPEIQLQNKGTAAKFDVKIKYQLLDKRNLVVDEQGETRSMRESLQLNPKYKIPGSVTEGKYTFKIIASSSGADPAIALASITIKEKSMPQDENTSNDEPPIDDGPPVIIIVDSRNDDEDVVTEAVDLAERGNSANAESLCLGLSNTLKRDECLSAIAASDQESSHCDAITDSDSRDSCFMAFIMNGDYTHCDKISNPLYQDTCDKLKHISTLPPLDDAGPSINDFTT